MASLVAEVLATSGGLEKEDLSTRMGKISEKVDSVKCDLYSFINRKYKDFNPSFISTIDLHGKVESLSKEISSLTGKIQNDVNSQISSSTHDFHDLSSQLTRTNAVLETLKVLCKVDESLENFSAALSNKEYMTACDLLETVQHQMKLLPRGKVSDMKILKSLKSELRVKQETMIHALSEAWSGAVMWKIPAVKDSDRLDCILTTQLKISRGNKVEDIIRAMCAVNVLNNRLQAFGKKVVDHLFKHIIVLNGVEPAFESTYQFITISLRRKPTKTKHIIPQLLYQHILSVLEKLQQQCLGITVEDKVTGENISLMKMFGDLIWKDLSQYIINHCLVHSIPTSSGQLESYLEVIQATEDFEKTLVKWGLLSKGTSPLLTYARDVNVHFANKKSQDLMVKARSLMISELHNTVDVGDDAPAAKLAKLASTDERDEKTAIADKDVLSEGTLRFPKCKISESIHKLMKLSYETLQEAVTSTTQCAVQLFYTVRNMFELFCEVVPTYHKQNLQQLPQLSALHHNNCMYIAHHLLTLGHQYKTQLPFPLCEGAATMIDLVPIYRKLASDCFLAQMRSQRSQILESLSGAAGFAQLEEDENREKSTRAVNQVLYQLNRLSSVWRDVLPSTVYQKAISTLINMFLQEMISKIIILEDISVNDAHQLSSLMKNVTEKVPPLLKLEESQERVAMELHVSQWTKFTELITVLEANLQEILDRWTDGKGPLAHAMTANEVRNLIRALFQNTEKRAATLAKIKAT
ncbi:centromere/kinetochore protein zw10 homolog [Ptychodera flava]|uniref:centromere/kinetochore protein zw10 homolog n=1 Tax=Ptychodera flava TaxID=63121 RepID=UPI003969EB84